MNDFNLDRSAPGLAYGEFKGNMREYDVKCLFESRRVREMDVLSIPSR